MQQKELPDYKARYYFTFTKLCFLVSGRLSTQVVVLTNCFFSSAGDAVDFMTWFLNALHGALGGTKKKPCKWKKNQSGFDSDAVWF